MGVKYTKIHERTQAAEGTTTVMNFIKLEFLSLNAFESEITNKTIPLANLSSKEYIPKTIAPCLLFVPITYDIKFIPVESVIDWAIPTTRAKIYIGQEVFLLRKIIDIAPIMHIAPPNNKEFFLPNF